jgi:diguanylate cyclase (GGDEF)-like protein
VFTEADGLKRADLEAIAQGQQAIWVAYRDSVGITKVQVAGKGLKLAHFTEQDGLSSSEVIGLAFDTRGELWAATDNGVDVYREGRWRQYSKEDGLIWDDSDSRALCAGPNGTMWVGTSGGLSRYTPTTDSPPALPAPVLLTSIRGDTRDYEPTDQPTLPYLQRSLSFQFSALDYAEESRMRFRYRLLGNDDTWKETHGKSVRFAGLPGGHYVFEVLAAGPNGLWSPQPARFAFSIKPLWWQTSWFIALGVLAVLMIGMASWRLRVRALVAQKELLERQVAERTAELLASHRQLEEIAYHDMLTGLPNRRMFTEQLRIRLATARRQHGSFGILLIDLDHFKRVNDQFGHDAGDAVLIETAKRLREALRESDCAARLGGDEFGILLVSPCNRVGIETVCGRIIDSFAVSIPFKEIELQAICSIGAAIFPEDGDNQEDLYKSADLALYESKRVHQDISG